MELLADRIWVVEDHAISAARLIGFQLEELLPRQYPPPPLIGFFLWHPASLEGIDPAEGVADLLGPHQAEQALHLGRVHKLNVRRLSGLIANRVAGGKLGERWIGPKKVSFRD